MAEAFGLASGIIGVVGVAIKVLRTVVDFGLDWKEAPEEARNLVRELEGLKIVLTETNMNVHLLGPDSTSTLDSKSAVLGPEQLENTKLMLKDCEAQLARLLGDLEKLAGRGRGISWDRLKRTFLARRTDDIVQKLNRKCNTINNSMAVTLGIANLKEAKEMMGEVRGIRGEVKNLHQDVKRQQSLDERQVILKWLTPLDYNPTLSDLLDRREEGTGNWLLGSDEFGDWLDRAGQTLFCPGIPGAGKTILAATVIEHLCSRFQNDATGGVAFLFCDFQQLDRRPSDLLLSILKQFVQKMASVPRPVLDLYTNYRESQKKPLFQDILRTLHSVLADCPRAFVIVDGLDEYRDDNGNRGRFLSELIRIQRKTAVNIFATSRPIPEIARTFGECPSLEIRANDTDMRKYIEAHIAQLPAFVQRKQTLQQEIKTGVVDAAKGMFLLAQLHLDSLKGKTSPKAVKVALDQFSSGAGSYDRAYEGAMKRIKSQETQELAMQALLWITCARRRLSRSELQHALAFEEDTDELDEENVTEIEDILSACAGLVTIDEESDSVRLIHYTAQEYFERTGQDWFPEAHSEIAKTCVGYLLFDAFESGPCSTEEDFADRLQANVLYEYAAQNWGYHVHAAGDGTFLRDQETRGLLLKFLEDKPKTSASYQAIIALKGGWNDDHLTTRTTGLHLAAFFGLENAVDALLGKYGLELEDSNRRTPLSLAAESGHEAVSRLLLSKGARTDTSSGKTPLWLAAQNGHQRVVELLLSNGADPNARDSERWTPLWLAVLNRHKTTTELLLARGADLNAEDSRGRTLLIYAAQHGLETVVKMLIKRGALVDAQDSGDRTALWFASWYGHGVVAEFLLNNKASPDAGDRRGRTGLWRAARDGDEAIVNLLLGFGADVNASDSEGWTPLLLATRNKHEAMVMLLLSKGARVDAGSSDGRTPLSIAAECGYEELVRRLLSNADPDKKDSKGRTPLSYSADNGYGGIVRLLVDKGATLDSTTSASCGFNAGRTPLSFAAENGHLEITELLSSRGANPDYGDASGRTPLSFAAENGHEAVARLLIHKGANISSEATGGFTAGRTPLSFAAENGHAGLVKTLLQSSLIIDLQDCNGRTPLSYAAEKGREEVSEILLQHGAQPNLNDHDGWTPLWFAVQNGYTTVVRGLLDRGAQPDLKATHGSMAGHTPLSLAIEHGHCAIAELLLCRGAGADSDITGRTHAGRTPLSFAAEGGHQAIVELLLAQGASPDSRDTNGRTPLSFAAQNGHEDVAKILLQKRAEPDSMVAHGFDKGRTPLSYAAEYGRHSMAQLLLEQQHGGKGTVVDVNSLGVDGRTPLLYAVGSGYLLTVKLLAGSADLNSCASDGRTALSLAAENGNLAIASLLIEAGARPDPKDTSGRTPLSFAAQSGSRSSRSIAQALLDKGAQVDSKTTSAFNAGRTPLSFAAENGNAAVAQLLLERGADCGSEDIDGWTPLLFAAQNGRLLTARVLLEKGQADPDPKARGSFSVGRTPLSFAAENGHAAVAKLLVQKGASLNATDADGRTPLSYAADNGRDAVVELLVDHGAYLPARTNVEAQNTIVDGSGRSDKGGSGKGIERHIAIRGEKRREVQIERAVRDGRFELAF